MKTNFIDGLAAFGGALTAARRVLAARPDESAATIRRIARVMLGVDAVSESPELAQICRSVVDGPDADLPVLVATLVETVRKRCAAEHADRVVILLVDDDPVIAHVLYTRLRSSSREILTVASAAAALDVLQHRLISLVILDLGLSDRDGRDVLAEIRLSGAEPAPPVIVLSAMEDPHVKTECFALGADEYFEKPVDLDLLTTVVSAKLQRAAEIGRKLRHDPLTGVLNRLSFTEMYVRNSAFMTRAGGDLSIAILDLDRFKTVNDTFGHAVGDEVLRQTAVTLEGSLRKSDSLGRWGGEEFVVLFPGTDCAGSAKSLANVAVALSTIDFNLTGGKPFKVTFSAGVTQVAAGTPIEAAVAEADTLLYRAKNQGRNRIVSPAGEILGS